MAGPERPSYRLAPAAETDLEDIWRYGARTWSADQADQYADALFGTFERLAAMPGMARERRTFDPPVRIHPSGAHIVVYRIEEQAIVILRVLGGRQDWQALLKEDPEQP